MATKEFTIKLTGKQRWDLWLFVFRAQGVKARDRDALRNLDAVCETFGITEIQAKAESLVDGEKFGMSDVGDMEVQTGSVDLKRLIEYLSTMPDGIETALALRLLRISDLLADAKDKRARLESIPPGGD